MSNSKYKFFVPVDLERRILNYAKENEEPVETPNDLAADLIEFSSTNKTRQVTFVDYIQGEDVWYTVYIDGDKFLCYELTEDLLRRTNYGMA